MAQLRTFLGRLLISWIQTSSSSCVKPPLSYILGEMEGIVIPTMGRPVSLGSTLHYISTFFPEREVWIAEGVTAQHRNSYDRIVNHFAERMTLHHKTYPAELPKGSRLLDLIADIPEEIVTLGSDDDFPDFHALDAAASLLTDRSDLVTATGPTLKFLASEDKVWSARLNHVFAVDGASARQRLLHYARWPFPTYYGPTRKSHLLGRLRFIDSCYVAGFGDFAMGVYDLIHGGIGAVPHVSRVATHSAKHRHIRRDGRLSFLQQCEEISKLRQKVVQELADHSGSSKLGAEELVVKLFAAKVAQLAGYPPRLRMGFESQSPWTDALVQEQRDHFDQLLDSTTTTHAQWSPTLRAVRNAIRLPESLAPDDHLSEIWPEVSAGSAADNPQGSAKNFSKTRVKNERSAKRAKHSRAETARTFQQISALREKINPDTMSATGLGPSSR